MAWSEIPDRHADSALNSEPVVGQGAAAEAAVGKGPVRIFN